MKIARTLIALVTLLFLIFAIPAGLITFYGNPLPTSLPTLDDIAKTLTSNDTFGLFLFVLVWTGWIAWATFTFSVLVEIISRLHNAPTPQIRGLSMQQGLATLLISAILGGSIGPAMATPTDYIPPITSISQETTTENKHLPEITPTENQQSLATQTAQIEGFYITVQAGDSAWSLAERHLGDGTRWKELVEVNYNREQPGGGYLKPGEDPYIYPGWQLLVPGTQNLPATEIAALEKADQTQRYQTLTLQEGETLYSLAELHLGNSDRWQEIWAASTDIPQPNGHLMLTAEDAKNATTGWTVRIPTDSPIKAPITSLEEQATPTQHAQTNTDIEIEPSTNTIAIESDTEKTADNNQIHPTPGLSKLINNEINHAQTSAEKTQKESDNTNSIWIGIGSLLAASILGTILYRRINTLRSRQPGYSMPKAAVIESEELQLTRIQDKTSLEFVNRALKTLAVLNLKSNNPIPNIRLARLTENHLELYASSTSHLPYPFEPTDDDATWLLPRNAPLATDEQIADIAAPYPALVTIGNDAEENQILVDLEHLAALGIQASSTHSIPVMRAITLSLATSHWADDLSITTVGICPELEGHLESGRITYAHTVSELLENLEEKLQHDQEILATLGHNSAQQARNTTSATDIWAPEIIIIGTNMSLSEQARLRKIVEAKPQLAVAVISNDDQTTLSDWRLHIESLETAYLQPLGLPLQPQYLNDETYNQILNTLDIATTTEPSITEPQTPHPIPLALKKEPEILLTPEELNQTLTISNQDPFIRIFGSLEIENANGAVEANKINRLTEIAIYIHLNPGIRDTDFAADLWPGIGAGQNTRQTAISKLRRWLGSNTEGIQYLPRASGKDGSYTFTNEIKSDYEIIKNTAQNRSNATNHELADALKLVRGAPFQNAPRNRYNWTSYLHSWAITHVTDIAHELATRALDSKDYETALWATQKGLITEPLTEFLWQDRLKAAKQNPELHEKLTWELYALAEDEEYPLSSDTLMHTFNIVNTKRKAS